MQNDMREEIKAYLERIFSQAPCTQKAIEMKEAILADVLEKYDDMVSEGMPPEDAYGRAVGGIGDLDKLIRDLRAEQPSYKPPHTPKQSPVSAPADEGRATRRAVYKSIKNALWILILVCYFLISFGTDAWHITWLIFLIGGAVENVLRAIFDLMGGI